MSTHKSQIGTWMSRLAQSAYGTASAAGADYRRVVSNDQNVIELDTAFEDNAAYDTGSDVADDMWAITNDSGLSIPFDFCFQDIGYWLHMALGGYSVSGPDGAGRYSHIFTPQNMNTSRQLPVRTFGKKYGGLKIVIMRDGVCTQLSISGQKTGRLKCSANVKGSGHYAEDPASYVQPSMESDRDYGYSQNASFYFNDDTVGTLQVETATVAVTTVTAGNVTVIVTGAAMGTNSPVTLSVPVAGGETANAVAALIVAAMKANFYITNAYVVTAPTANTIALTARVKAADDATLNISIANGTSGGVTTAASSANTTAGVVGDYQTYSCAIESWTFTIENPESDPGYRVCSPFLVTDTPSSGAIRSEYLVGTRKYTVTFETRLLTGDKMRGYLKNGTNLNFDLPILGTAAEKHTLHVSHTKMRVTESKESIVGDYIGVKGTVQGLSSSGTIPLTCTLLNDVASYTS